MLRSTAPAVMTKLLRVEVHWVFINISMACEQAVRRGGRITDSMFLVLLFQGLYIADGLYNEVRHRFSQNS